MYLERGMRVTLNTPDNQRLHGKSVLVEEVTEWGANVIGTGVGSGRFRALFEEMTIDGQQRQQSSTITAYEAANNITVGIGTNSVHGTELFRPDILTHNEPDPFSARSQGYTGDICDECGGCKLRRVGTCAVCEDCGRSSGCV